MIHRYYVDGVTNEIVIDFTATKDCSITFSLLSGHRLVTDFVQNVFFKQGRRKIRWGKNDFLSKQVAAGNYTIAKLEHNIKVEPVQPVIGNSSRYWQKNRFGNQKAATDAVSIGGYLYITTVLLKVALVFPV